MSATAYDNEHFAKITIGMRVRFVPVGPCGTWAEGVVVALYPDQLRVSVETWNRTMGVWSQDLVLPDGSRGRDAGEWLVPWSMQGHCGVESHKVPDDTTH